MIGLTRADIQASFPQITPKTLRALEELFREVDAGTSALSTGVEATKNLQDATVITLSPNDALTSERVIEAGQGIQLTDTGNALIVGLSFSFRVNGGRRLTLNVLADTDFTIPFDGTAVVSEYPLVTLKSAADDSAAATTGVPVRGLYHNAGAVRVRLT